MIYAVIQAPKSQPMKLLAQDQASLNSFLTAYNLETQVAHEIVFSDPDMGTVVVLPEDFDY